MHLSYISITNYRSITKAYKLDLSKMTVLLGKNNEGKTNIIKAINLGMEILRDMRMLHKRKRLPIRLYDWREDFPISLQCSRKTKKKNTEIRMDFTLSDEETKLFFDKVESTNNGYLSVYIMICEDNTLSVTIPKRGRNASALTNKVVKISEFICEHFDVQYIPAVRSEGDAYDAISALVDEELASIDDEQYKKSLEYIQRVQQERLKQLSKKVKIPLKKFLPQIKSINLNISNYTRHSRFVRTPVNIEIDDGVLTSLSHKGDGVKSLVSIAMLSQISSQGDRLIIIDEPENHLHPEAVHYIDYVMKELSERNQVMISTHNPIFVNRGDIASNLIVDSGEVVKADRVETIRKILGVSCSDNLIYSDYVIVVEGPSDKEVLMKLFEENESLKECLDSKILTIRSIGGTHNLKNEIYALQQFCCNYMIIVDYDSAGKTAVNELKLALPESTTNVRYFMKKNRKDTELEDLYSPEVYKEYLLKKGIDISDNGFKNTSIKWSNKIKNIATSSGIDFTKEMESEIKRDLSNLITHPICNSLTAEGYNLMSAIAKAVEADLRGMNLVK